MQHDSGAPAFNNIDDLLADKIVKHSMKHTDHPEPEETVQPTTQKHYTQKKRSSHRFTVKLLLACIVIGLLYVLSRSSRNS